MQNFFETIKLRPDIFPGHWSCESLLPDDVFWITENINPSSKLITKSRLNSEHWQKARLCNLIEFYGENWSFADDLMICVWLDGQNETEPPIGFVAFSIAWTETNSRRVNLLRLDVGLFWVRPDKRGLGGCAARHVVSHLMHYLSQCKLIHPFVSLSGVDVLCRANFHSKGGERVFDIIENYLDWMKDAKRWKIRRIEIDAG